MQIAPFSYKVTSIENIHFLPRDWDYRDYFQKCPYFKRTEVNSLWNGAPIYTDYCAKYNKEKQINPHQDCKVCDEIRKGFGTIYFRNNDE